MITVAGEALIDLLPRGGDPLACLDPRRGGGPYNAAVALGRLGTRTAFLSRISRDPFGEALLDGLHAAGVRTEHVQRGPEPTPLAVAAIAADGSARYTFHVQGTADRLFTAPTRLPAGTEAVLLGACSLVLEPGATGYEAVLRRARAEGAATALDPNIRPALIPDAEAYRRRFASWLADVDMLKLSVEDAAWLAGGASPEKAVRHWLDCGPRAVVLTAGGEGLSVHTAAAGTVRVPAAPGPVADTIGAGDTVNAALLHWLSAREALHSLAGLKAADWRAALGFAARAAAVTCSRPGADPPHAGELR